MATEKGRQPLNGRKMNCEENKFILSLCRKSSRDPGSENDQLSIQGKISRSVRIDNEVHQGDAKHSAVTWCSEVITNGINKVHLQNSGEGQQNETVTF